MTCMDCQKRSVLACNGCTDRRFATDEEEAFALAYAESRHSVPIQYESILRVTDISTGEVLWERENQNPERRHEEAA